MSVRFGSIDIFWEYKLDAFMITKQLRPVSDVKLPICQIKCKWPETKTSAHYHTRYVWHIKCSMFNLAKVYTYQILNFQILSTVFLVNKSETVEYR